MPASSLHKQAIASLENGVLSTSMLDKCNWDYN